MPSNITTRGTEIVGTKILPTANDISRIQMVPDLEWFYLGFFFLRENGAKIDTRSVETALQFLNFDLFPASSIRYGTVP